MSCELHRCTLAEGDFNGLNPSKLLRLGSAFRAKRLEHSEQLELLEPTPFFQRFERSESFDELRMSVKETAHGTLVEPLNVLNGVEPFTYG